MSVRLQLLSAPRKSDEINGKLPIDKPASLLYYLAIRADWVSRNELAFLYRPDVEIEVALGNVRKLLHRAKEHSWAVNLEVEKSRVRFKVDSDVNDFKAAIALKNWVGALELYQGQFLDGINLPDVPGYEAWLSLERSDLTQAWQVAVRERVKQLEESEDFLRAITLLEDLRRHDPLDEEAVQALLRVLGRMGRRKQALEVFEAFRAELSYELHTSPLETTRVLADQIRLGDASSLLTQISQGSSFLAKHNLPAPTTRFIGRKRELNQLAQNLLEMDGRLISLIGLGGVGKTRLALELAWGQISVFLDGVWFVPLAGVQSNDQLVAGIASSLGFAFSGAREPLQQLLDHLHEKHLLLVLDNFEQLVDSALIVAQILQEAAQVRVVVTTRVALEVQAEWLFDLTGLSYPIDTSEALESFDAVKLFINRAERISARFKTNPEIAQIAVLCRKVEGLPLALELAASWTRTLSLQEILTELEKSSELLSSRYRDVVDRHRSLRIVFDGSWLQLSTLERTALAALSVFADGFTLVAAEQVTGTHRQLLLGLMNQSLIRRDHDGRFTMHELIKHFAYLQLNPEQIKQFQNQLSAYFVGFLETRETRLKNAEQVLAMAEIKAELANIFKVWDLILNQQDSSELERTLEAFRVYLELTGRYQDAKKLFDLALQHIQSKGLVWAKLLVFNASFYSKLGLLDESQALIDQAIPTLKKHKASQTLGFAEFSTGVNKMLFGKFDQAQTHFLQALSIYQIAKNNWAIARVYNQLASIAWSLGELQSAQDWDSQALELAKTCGDTSEIAIVLNSLGITSESSGQIERAIEFYREALHYFSQLGFLRGQAAALTNLGHVFERQKDFQAAKIHYSQSLSIKKTLGDPISIAVTLTNLADVLFELGELESAQKANLEALELTGKAKAQHYTARVIWSFARMFAHSNRMNDAVRLASFLSSFEECEQWVRDETSEVLKTWTKATSGLEQPELTLEAQVEWLKHHYRIMANSLIQQ